MNTGAMQQTSFEMEHISFCIDACLSELQDPARYPLRGGISTGFSDLDEVTSGIAPTSFNVIAGRPCMGVTTLALSIGLNIAIDQNKPCAIFSLTESKSCITNRLLAVRSGVERERIQRVDLNEDQQTKISKAAEEIRSSPIFIVDSAFSVPAIQEKLDELVAIDFNPTIVIIDDLSELAPLHDRRKVKKVVKQIKRLIHESDVAVILTSPLLRTPEKRKFKGPRLDDVPTRLRYPSPDLLCLLYRDAYYNQTLDRENCTASIGIGSNRHGPQGSAYLNFSRGQFVRDA